MAMETLALSRIIADERCQPRAMISPDLTDEYAEAMTDGADFPPLTVYGDGDRYWLADGFHRLAAAKQLERNTITVEIRTGGIRDAILHAVGANADHGMRRTNYDKRRAVAILLEDAEWSRWSDAEIARRCAVSHPFVGRLRESILKPLQDSPRLATRNGTTYAVNTANIGKRATAVLDPGDDDDEEDSESEIEYEVVDNDTGKIVVEPNGEDRAWAVARGLIQANGVQVARTIAAAIYEMSGGRP